MPTLDEVIDLISAAKARRGGDGYLSVADVTDVSEIRRVASFVHAVNDPESDEVDAILATLIPDDDARGDVACELLTFDASPEEPNHLWSQVDPAELRRCTKIISDQIAESR